MNPIWIRTLILVCIFGAVVLAVESLFRAYAAARAKGRAINLRLTLIGRGRTHGETMNILRRAASTIPQWLPPSLKHYAQKFEETLMRAQLTIPTGRLMLILVIAPFVIFFALLLLMSSWWGIGISSGRMVISATFAIVLGALLPIFLTNFKAA